PVRIRGRGGVERQVQWYGARRRVAERGEDRRRGSVEEVLRARRIGRPQSIRRPDQDLVVGQVRDGTRGLAGGGDTDDADRDPKAEGDGGQRGGGARLVPGEVAEGEAGREREVPGQAAEAANGGRRGQRGAEHDGQQPQDQQQRLHVRTARLGPE